MTWILGSQPGFASPGRQQCGCARPSNGRGPKAHGCNNEWTAEERADLSLLALTFGTQQLVPLTVPSGCRFCVLFLVLFFFFCSPYLRVPLRLNYLSASLMGRRTYFLKRNLYTCGCAWMQLLTRCFENFISQGLSYTELFLMPTFHVRNSFANFQALSSSTLSTAFASCVVSSPSMPVLFVLPRRVGRLRAWICFAERRISMSPSPEVGGSGLCMLRMQTMPAATSVSSRTAAAIKTQPVHARMRRRV